MSVQYSLERIGNKEAPKTGTFAGKATKDNEPLTDTLMEKMAGEIVSFLDGK